MRPLLVVLTLAGCRYDVERISDDEGDAGATPVSDGAVGNAADGEWWRWDAPSGWDGGSCTGVGGYCEDSSACLAWQTCEVDVQGGGGVCVASRPICGGFAAAECPLTAPNCLWAMHGDYGVCATDGEAACICYGWGRYVLSCSP